MFKLLVIVILAWLILRTARNLLVAALGPKSSLGDATGVAGRNSSSAGPGGDAKKAGHAASNDVEDAVWEDLP